MKLNMNKDAIRIAVLADTHVPANRTLLGPWAKGFDQVVAIAKQYQCHAVVQSGDSRVDSNSSQDAQDCETRHLILPLAQAGISYWVIDGNHDRRGASHGEVTANSWLQHQKDLDLWIGVEYWNDYIPKMMHFGTEKQIQILPLPYPPRHAFAIGKELKTKTELDAEASEYIQTALKNGLNKLDNTSPLLILFHGTVDSPRLKTAGEARMPAGHDVNIPINAFPKLKNCAVACGHIHMVQVLSEAEPLVFYAGPLIPMEFDSEGLETGVTIIEFHQGQVRHEFVPVHTVEYKTVTVDLAGADPSDLAVDTTTEQYITNEVKGMVPAPDRTIVKIVIKTTPGQSIDKGAVRDALEAAGIIEPRIVVELPESPAVAELEKKCEAEIGANVQSNVQAYLAEHPEAVAALAVVGSGEQDCLDAAGEIEQEVFK